MGDPDKNLHKDVIILRNYPKVIFFWPLFVISIIFWLIQTFSEDLNPWLGSIWVIIFFSNFTVTALDFPSYRVLILILVVAITSLILIFLGLIPTLKEIGVIEKKFNLGLPTEFYMIMMIILGVILGLVIISSRFDYYKIEMNEVYHEKGIFYKNTERFPTKGLRIKKKIPDLFEYLMLKAGSISLILPKDNIIELNTIINVKKKAEQIDFLLSHLHIAIEKKE